MVSSFWHVSSLWDPGPRVVVLSYLSTEELKRLVRFLLPAAMLLRYRGVIKCSPPFRLCFIGDRTRHHSLPSSERSLINLPREFWSRSVHQRLDKRHGGVSAAEDPSIPPLPRAAIRGTTGDRIQLAINIQIIPGQARADLGQVIRRGPGRIGPSTVGPQYVTTV
eukprot:420885-Hanusia_phi.AAC.2